MEYTSDKPKWLFNKYAFDCDDYRIKQLNSVQVNDNMARDERLSAGLLRQRLVSGMMQYFHRIMCKDNLSIQNEGCVVIWS